MNAIEERILLLSCRLGQEVRPLTPAEYLPLFSAPEEDLEELGGRAAMALLDRRKALESYLSAAPDIRAVTCLSEEYPPRLGNLGAGCPPVLFCRGDVSLLKTPCIALVGSRELWPRGYAFARRIGQLAAWEGYTLVSGGAIGADTVAQHACLEAGGRVISFVPDALYRHGGEKNLLLCSAEGYDVAFSASRALARNHYIHALGLVAFVAQCPRRAGGTWAGAVYNLKRRLSPVCVINDGTRGAADLVAAGASYVEENLDSIGFCTPRQLSIFDEV